MDTPKNNEDTAKAPTGFGLHPENINLKGRPKRGWTWAELLEDAMEEVDSSGLAAKKITAQKVVAKAKEGDILAFREIVDRMDGKAKQPVVGGDDDDHPIQHSVIVKFVSDPSGTA